MRGVRRIRRGLLVLLRSKSPHKSPFGRKVLPRRNADECCSWGTQMYRVMEDLDVDASGWAIEGMSEIDYHEPLDAVKCNERSKAFPEDVRKMVELLKVCLCSFPCAVVWCDADMGVPRL